MLLAIGRLLESRSRYFEISDGIRVLRGRRDEDPRQIKFGVARGGGLESVKVERGTM
jgi:hypothetical protein